MTGTKNAKLFSQKGATKNGVSLFSSELGDFSNGNADAGFDFEDESSESSSDDSSDDSSSSDSLTHDSDSEANQDGDNDVADDVIKGLNIVGNGYQMSGNWSPGQARAAAAAAAAAKKQTPPSNADVFNMASFCTSMNNKSVRARVWPIVTFSSVSFRFVGSL